MKRCFIDCSEQQQPNEPPGDLPMTPTYEYIDPTFTPGAAYARMQKPELGSENPIVLRQ